ncbi:arrestin domain-containing protein 1 [Biomphalaria pfeifferi]|uniref:Arrestin domain-containing protein 1 n=1 Tax=Biomphalaria pfeifferi TaxID=112525 RepID=A0AAD8C9N9_BIOPF|nr:arrestin domain-containing protein 1 [Biomphalaria pfeifferi]
MANMRTTSGTTDNISVEYQSPNINQLKSLFMSPTELQSSTSKKTATEISTSVPAQNLRKSNTKKVLETFKPKSESNGSTTVSKSSLIKPKLDSNGSTTVSKSSLIKPKLDSNGSTTVSKSSLIKPKLDSNGSTTVSKSSLIKPKLDSNGSTTVSKSLLIKPKLDSNGSTNVSKSSLIRPKSESNGSTNVSKNSSSETPDRGSVVNMIKLFNVQDPTENSNANQLAILIESGDDITDTSKVGVRKLIEATESKNVKPSNNKIKLQDKRNNNCLSKTNPSQSNSVPETNVKKPKILEKSQNPVESGDVTTETTILDVGKPIEASESKNVKPFDNKNKCKDNSSKKQVQSKTVLSKTNLNLDIKTETVANVVKSSIKNNFEAKNDSTKEMSRCSEPMINNKTSLLSNSQLERFLTLKDSEDSTIIKPSMLKGGSRSAASEQYVSLESNDVTVLTSEDQETVFDNDASADTKKQTQLSVSSDESYDDLTDDVPLTKAPLPLYINYPQSADKGSVMVLLFHQMDLDIVVAAIKNNTRKLNKVGGQILAYNPQLFILPDETDTSAIFIYFMSADSGVTWLESVKARDSQIKSLCWAMIGENSVIRGRPAPPSAYTALSITLMKRDDTFQASSSYTEKFQKLKEQVVAPTKEKHGGRTLLSARGVTFATGDWSSLGVQANELSFVVSQWPSLEKNFKKFRKSFEANKDLNRFCSLHEKRFRKILTAEFDVGQIQLVQSE